METNFNDIQQLWKSQKAKNIDLSGLIQQLKATEKKQKLEWIIGVVCLPITVIFLVMVLPLKDSLLGTLTLILLSLAMGWVLWLNSKSLLRTVDESDAYSQKDYLQSQLTKLNLRGKIIQKHMISYGLILILAINLGYLEVLAPLATQLRILAHLGATLLVIGVMWVTLRKKRKAFEAESRPAIRQLEKLLTEMN
jgi:hypothetical protein